MANIHTLLPFGKTKLWVDLGTGDVAEVFCQVDASGNILGGSTPSTLQGALTNNNAAPGATNVGVLPAVANASSVSYTEGRQVLQSVDLFGRLRVRGTGTNNNAAPTDSHLHVLAAVANAALPTFVEGNCALLSTDLSGRLRVAGSLTNNNAVPAQHLGVLAAVANASVPSWSEGNEVLLSADLSGRLRTAGTLTHNNAAPGANLSGVLPALANAAAPTYTEADLVLQSVDLAGNQRTTLGTQIWGEDSGNGILRVGQKGGGWSVTHNPTVNNVATISQASGGGTVRNVLTSLSFGIANDATGPTATILTVNLRDGGTGAGTILRSWTLFAPTTVGYNFNISLAGLWIEGSQATAMTLEFAAGLTHTLEYVNMSGVTIAA